MACYKWQNIVVFRDDDVYKEWEKGIRYPSQTPSSDKDWNNLIEEFFFGLDKALQWTSSHDDMKKEIDPGITMEDAMWCLSVHNAYHLAKIVALRQMIGAWPPKEELIDKFK